MDAGVMPPDDVGYELEQAGEVIAQAELAWRSARVVLLMPEHADGISIWVANGWKPLVAEGDWQHMVASEIKAFEDKSGAQQENQ